MEKGGRFSAASCVGIALALWALPFHGVGAVPGPEKEIEWKPAEHLLGLEIQRSEEGLVAIIEADGAMEHRVYVQDEPLRLVLDILNVKNPLKIEEPQEPDPILERVSSQELPMSAYVRGEYEKTFGRITFDLKTAVEYRVRAEEGQLTVDLVRKTFDTGEPPTVSEPVETSDNSNTDDLVTNDQITDGQIGDDLGTDDTSVIDEAAEDKAAVNLNIEPPDIDPELFFNHDGLSSDGYRLGPEDVIEVRVFELDQLNRTVRVAGDGSMELPLIGSIPVNGLTPDDVADQVADRLRDRFVQNPQVSVFVKEFHSQKVSLLGAIRNPATYPLVGRRNLLQILADAGGLSGAAGNVLFVFRQADDGRSARLSVPLHDLLIFGDPQWNIWLRAGDIISVPPEAAVSVSILGAVRSPGVYKLPMGNGASILNAIARAGGLDDRASKGGVQIKRRDPTGGEMILKVDLGNILSGKDPDVILQEGDVVVVKESFF
ncbi:MAG: polysaccharide biosynthesis/export family protein [Vicinamibacteria bacterium]